MWQHLHCKFSSLLSTTITLQTTTTSHKNGIKLPSFTTLQRIKWLQTSLKIYQHLSLTLGTLVLNKWLKFSFNTVTVSYISSHVWGSCKSRLPDQRGFVLIFSPRPPQVKNDCLKIWALLTWPSLSGTQYWDFSAFLTLGPGPLCGVAALLIPSSPCQHHFRNLQKLTSHSRPQNCRISAINKSFSLGCSQKCFESFPGLEQFFGPTGPSYIEKYSFELHQSLFWNQNWQSPYSCDLLFLFLHFEFGYQLEMSSNGSRFSFGVFAMFSL